MSDQTYIIGVFAVCIGGYLLGRFVITPALRKWRKWRKGR